MNKIHITLMLSAGLLAACTGSMAENSKPISNKTEITLKPAQSGAWQLFWMPKEWIVKNLTSSKLDNLYLAVRPPNHSDLNEYWPCYAPPRLMVGIYPSNGNSKEMLHSCFDYCGPNDKPGDMHKGLWGPDTKLSRVDVTLKGNKIVLKENYSNRREEAELDNDGRSMTQVKYRTWQRTISPQQLMKLHETSSCLELD